MYLGSARPSFEEPGNSASHSNDSDPREHQDHDRSVRSAASTSPWTPNVSQPELSAQLGSLAVSGDPHHTRVLAQTGPARSPHPSDSLQRQAMDVAYRPDGFGQHNLKHSHYRMGGPNMYDPNERRPGASDTSDPVWPVPRMNQSYAGDRSRDAAHFSSSQPDFARHQSSSDHYAYDTNSAALRNPIVYSQPVHGSWGMTGPHSDYTYPTIPYMNSNQRQPGPYFSGLPYGEGGAGGGNSDGLPRIGHPSSGDSSEHAEPLWPLAPNSLEAFAGIPAPPGSAARLTLTSASDRAKLKTRSSLPPPKQFKCSACDAIFSRNHDLKRHARIHLAVKPFPCGYCDKAFSRKDALKRHVLVKGCGIGSKKPETRRRSATLSKLEHGDGSASISSGSGRGSRHESVLDMRSRDYLVRDDQAQMQQGLSRSFPSKYETSSWNSSVNAASSDVYPGNPISTRSGFAPIQHDGGESIEYSRDGNVGGSRGPAAQAQQLGQYQQYSQLAQPYAYGSHPHSGQYHQVPGGLVTTFTPSEDHSGSSPTEAQSRSTLTGLSVPEGLQPSYPKDARAPGADANAAHGTALPNFEGSGQGKDRFGQAAFPHPPALPPGATSTSDAGPKPELEQQYFGNNTH